MKCFSFKTVCEPGKGYTNGQCTTCDIGEYQGAYIKDACVSCGPGQGTQGTGTTSQNGCRKSPACIEV